MNSEENIHRFDAQSQNVSSKAYDFFCQDYWFAGYICFVIGLIVLAAVSVSMASACSSPVASSLLVISILQWVYLGTGFLVLISYVCIEALRKATNECWCYLLPCFWPCLCLGYCINYAEKDEEQRKANANRPVRPQKTQQTNPTAQVVVVLPINNQVPQPQQPLIYNPPNPQYYAPPQNPSYNPNYNTPGPTYIQPPTNPNAANSDIKPGTLILYNNNNTNNNNTNNNNAINNNNNNNTTPQGTTNNTNQNSSIDAEKVKDYAKDKGLKALNWVTSKVNNLNDKYNNPEGKQQ